MRIILILTLFISIQSFGQVPTGYQKRTVNERIQGKFMVDSFFNIPRYTDTTAANLHKGVDSCGSMFFSYTKDSVYYRACNPKRWICVGSGTGTTKTYPGSVIDSMDNVFLTGEFAEPATDPTVYGYQNGSYGYKPSVIVNLTNPTNGDFLNYLNGEWVNRPAFREMQFKANDVGYTAVGDSIMVDTSFNSTKLNLFREGELQWKTSSYEPYSYQQTNDTIIFHPPLAAGEKIIVQVYDTLQWSSITHFEPAGWDDLTFTTNTGVTNTSQVFTTTGSAGFGHTGLDVLKLASGQDGFIAMQYNASDGINFVLGFNTTNSEQGYTSFEAGVDIASGGDLYRIDLGGAVTITGCTGIATGTWVGINRTGSTVKMVKKTGALSGTLSDWTVCYTYTFSSSADLFIGCDGFTPGSAKMYTPQGYNVH